VTPTAYAVSPIPIIAAPDKMAACTMLYPAVMTFAVVAC
jgi:hypothetical protein